MADTQVLLEMSVYAFSLDIAEIRASARCLADRHHAPGCLPFHEVGQPASTLHCSVIAAGDPCDQPLNRRPAGWVITAPSPLIVVTHIDDRHHFDHVFLPAS